METSIITNMGLCLSHCTCREAMGKFTEITLKNELWTGYTHVKLMLCGKLVLGSHSILLSIYSKGYLRVCQEIMGGAVPYPHSILHLPSFSAFSTRSKFGKSLVSVKDGPLISSIRADGNGRRPRKKTYPEDNSRPFDGGSSLSPNKEEILALFKRIQSSISKGDTTSSKKRISKPEYNKPSAESILEVLHQSRARGKGKTSGRKGDKFQPLQKDSPKKEVETENLSTIYLKSTRPPSTFRRRSPVPTPSVPRDHVQAKSETLSPTSTLLIPTEEAEQENESLYGDDQQYQKFEEMKLPELKEVAKSKGIRGYSKLKKSELVELLSRSLNDTSP